MPSDLPALYVRLQPEHKERLDKRADDLIEPYRKRLAEQEVYVPVNRNAVQLRALEYGLGMMEAELLAPPAKAKAKRR